MVESLIVCLGAVLVTVVPEGDDGQVKVVRVDVCDRLYPDREPPNFVEIGPISVPRGGSAAFQFAVTGQKDVSCKMNLAAVTRDDGRVLDGRVRGYQLLPVHVEGNTQGSMKNRPGGEVPQGWMKSLVRAAPFDVLEVLVETGELKLAGGRTQAVLIDVEVDRDALPGRYTGRLELQVEESVVGASFAFLVHKTVLPSVQKLHSVHWFWPMPENLTDGEPPAWWSERHWRLIENSGRQLRRFGDDTMFTPLIEGREPLIRVSRKMKTDYEFDYSRFDRWVETFIGQDFEVFAGRHVVNMGREVWAVDRATGKTGPLLENPTDRAAWLDFLPIFYTDFYRHLQEKGWTDRYLQHQYDEPKDVELYKNLATLARRHMPGVRTIDAINNRPEMISPLLDVHVFNLVTLLKNAELAELRRSGEKAVWLYHCTSPYPPYPNRHLDRPLSECRLWPWICYDLRAEGFLYWAANLYRKADEYKTSLGPFPNGSQDPGHPPGDAWFYYRGPDGLRPSMRMVAFRAGVIDHTLLSMLGEMDQEAAASIVRETFPSPTAYRTDPAVYHAARRRVLLALDGEE